MKKKSYQRYSLYALTTLTSFSISSCQIPSSVTDVMPSDWNWNGNVTQVQTHASTTSTTPLSPSTSTASSTQSNAEVKVVDTQYGKQTIVIPPSYYLADGTPISHQTNDQTWVNEQNASGYTIQLASGAAPTVAETLQTAPKNARMAQVQYTTNGQSGYLGIYGSYATKQEAQTALTKLPQNLQSTATIESWRHIQEKIQSSIINTNDSSTVTNTQ